MTEDRAPRRRPSRRRRIAGADRGPRPIGDALDDVLAGLAPPHAGAGSPGRGTDAAAGTGDSREGREPAAPSAATWGTVFSRWEELVGPSLARHARPLRLEAGVLVVAVDLPPWATQVRALAPGILERLRERTGEALERLDVVVRP